MPTEQFDGVSVAAVGARVHCELGDAYRELLPRHPELSRWAAGTSLTLAVDQTGSVVPSSTLTGPFNAGTFGVDISLGATGKATRTALKKSYISLAESLTYSCPPAAVNPLQNSLGLKEWIVRVFEAQDADPNPTRLDPKDKAIGYTLEFSLDLAAGATPGFTFSRVSGKGAFAIDSKATHSLDLALVELSPEDYKTIFVPTKVKTGEKQVPIPGVKKLTGEQEMKTVAVYKTIDVPKRVPGLGEITRSRLDGILYELQLRTLLPRR
ncbi:MAG: hypothetical protein ACXWJB_12140 [Limisphaerales bacterium]